MKAIILAAGLGSRLAPATRVTCKQLLPVYDKPMIYYPLSTLMLGGIRDVLFITRPQDAEIFQSLFGDGTRLGMNYSYAQQSTPEGIAQALLIGRDFIGAEPSALILGDNIFFGNMFGQQVQDAASRVKGATVFCAQVTDSERYGIADMGADGRVRRFVEKPVDFISNWAVTGLYFFDGEAPDLAATLKPSARGELEITDLLNIYLEKGGMEVELFGRGTAWMDAGTPSSLLDAANFIHSIEVRTGIKIACLEEIALGQGYIDENEFGKLIETESNPANQDYLKRVLAER